MVESRRKDKTSKEQIRERWWIFRIDFVHSTIQLSLPNGVGSECIL